MTSDSNVCICYFSFTHTHTFPQNFQCIILGFEKSNLQLPVTKEDSFMEGFIAYVILGQRTTGCVKQGSIILWNRDESCDRFQWKSEFFPTAKINKDVEEVMVSHCQMNI